MLFKVNRRQFLIVSVSQIISYKAYNSYGNPFALVVPELAFFAYRVFSFGNTARKIIKWASRARWVARGLNNYGNRRKNIFKKFIEDMVSDGVEGFAVNKIRGLLETNNGTIYAHMPAYLLASLDDKELDKVQSDKQLWLIKDMHYNCHLLVENKSESISSDKVCVKLIDSKTHFVHIKVNLFVHVQPKTKTLYNIKISGKLTYGEKQLVCESADNNPNNNIYLPSQKFIVA